MLCQTTASGVTVRPVELATWLASNKPARRIPSISLHPSLALRLRRRRRKLQRPAKPGGLRKEKNAPEVVVCSRGSQKETKRRIKTLPLHKPLGKHIHTTAAQREAGQPASQPARLGSSLRRQVVTSRGAFAKASRSSFGTKRANGTKLDSLLGSIVVR